MAARSRLLGPLIGVATALLLGCVQEDGRRFNPLRELTEISADDERELGRKFDREILRHVEVIDDPIVAGLINDLGQSIVRQIEPQPFIYRFRVINDDELNAFAVPGGYIYFNSGTLLSEFRSSYSAGVGTTYDDAQLFSGRDFESSVIGRLEISTPGT